MATSPQDVRFTPNSGHSAGELCAITDKKQKRPPWANCGSLKTSPWFERLGPYPYQLEPCLCRCNQRGQRRESESTLQLTIFSWDTPLKISPSTIAILGSINSAEKPHFPNNTELPGLAAVSRGIRSGVLITPRCQQRPSASCTSRVAPTHRSHLSVPREPRECYRLPSRFHLEKLLVGYRGNISIASIAADRAGFLCLGFGRMCRSHADVLFSPFGHLWIRHRISPCPCRAEWNDRSGR